MKKRTIFSVIICVLVCLGLLAGCGENAPQGSGNKDANALKLELNGTWNQITDDGTPSLPDLGIPSGYIFYLDGTGVDTFWDMTFSYTIDEGSLHIAYDDKLGDALDYTYTIEGDTLTLTRVDDEAITMLYQREKEQP